MIGIVVVSHSYKIAEGTKDLALQMAPDIRIEVAGGTADGSIGTDINKIKNALNKVMDDDGVLVLCDLGSSLMLADMAIDACDNPKACTIVDGPLVESTILAAVEVAMNKSKEEIIKDIEASKTESKIHF